jgi:CheY-like chemotaxis protein
MTMLLTAQDTVTVLVVDDSDDQRRLLMRYFERAGCEVIEASSAEDAIAACEEANPDLAVIDLVLPGMNGWELSDRFRGERPECVIAITSVLDPTDYPDCDVALPKPFTGAEVLQVLRGFVPKWKEK